MKLSAKAQKAMDKVVSKFESGDLSPIVQVARIKRDPDAPSAKWTFSNQVMAYAQSDSIDCRGYRQWQEAGRQVRKGEMASFILGPLTVKDDKASDPKARKLVGFRTIAVFGYHQTDPIDDSAAALLSYAPADPPPLMDVAQRFGIDCIYHPIVGALGSCTTDGERIKLGTGDARTFFHELSHAVHARLNGDDLEGGQDAEQETVAEFTASVLMNLYGLGDRTGNSWNYIKHYNDDPLRAVMKALGTVEKVLSAIEQEKENGNEPE